MKLVIWCVEKASVKIPKLSIERKINKGLLVYFWVSKIDTELSDEEIDKKLDKIVSKLINTKFFVNPDTDKIEFSLQDVNWEILLISNFTLYGENKKGTKLDFSKAWNFTKSKQIYDSLVKKISEKIIVKTGEFWEYMIVECVNAGPLNYVINY